MNRRAPRVAPGVIAVIVTGEHPVERRGSAQADEQALVGLDRLADVGVDAVDRQLVGGRHVVERGLAGLAGSRRERRTVSERSGISPKTFS